MCGIAGAISSISSFVTEENIKKGISCLSHRGPDNQNTWINESKNAALGHSRLSIIDLSSEADQPMHLNDRYTIVFNGEIYNYIEIRNELEKKGYAFHTRSDTEVLLASYDAWNSKCLDQLNGMFAFAIWDEKEQMLFAARDRFGERPFYFYYDDNQFKFASEMKALWNMGVEKKVNLSLLYNFLTIGYTCNPAEPDETFYQYIHKLPSASVLFYYPHKHHLQIEKYWMPHIEENKYITENEALERFKSLFSESIKLRLRSDVAIGTSLSGGLDSSSIVAFCEEEEKSFYTHKCFTASFPGFEKNEIEYALQVADKFNLKLHEVRVNENDIIELMQKVMFAQEEPIGSASVLAQYRVFEKAKENEVTVLLDGQGADEILAGYTKYYRYYWRELYRQRNLNNLGERNYAVQLGVKEPFTFKDKIAAFFPELSAGIWQTQKSKKAFRQSDLDKNFAFTHKRQLYYTTPTSFTLNGVLYYNAIVNGLEELLRYADRNSMACSTEVRLPFLDHHLVEFLFSLPPHFKINKGRTKYLLRKAVSQMLPENIVWRKDKTGFEPPQKHWMQLPKVQDAIMDGKKKLVNENILQASVLKSRIGAHDAHTPYQADWRYWTASFLF